MLLYKLCIRKKGFLELQKREPNDRITPLTHIKSCCAKAYRLPSTVYLNFYSLVPEGSDVRFGQKRTFERLFNDLVGSGEQRRGHGETERLCCLQVYDQLVFAWRLHRQISRFLAA